VWDRLWKRVGVLPLVFDADDLRCMALDLRVPIAVFIFFDFKVSDTIFIFFERSEGLEGAPTTLRSGHLSQTPPKQPKL
jgi:hypothetical protein